MEDYILTLYDENGNPIPIPAIQGIGIKEIRLKEEGEDADAYEIVLDDGRVFVFYAKHGRQGKPGEKGAPGVPGKGLDIKGTYASLSALQSAVTAPEQGDMYNVGASAPYTIYMYDANLGWVSQGQLQGAPGAVFTPHVDEDGNLSWTNDGGLANPDQANIRGPQGPDGSTGPAGNDGKSAEITQVNATVDGNTGTPGVAVELSGTAMQRIINFRFSNLKGNPGAAGADGKDVTVTNVSESTEDGGTNTVTFSNGQVLNVRNGRRGDPGETGPTGPAGADGKDYVLTGDDKTAIAALVFELLPTWNGGSY